MVARLVRVLVGAAGRRGALPGPLAEQGDVAREVRAMAAEITGLEGAEHVRDLHPGLGVDPVDQGVEGGGQLLRRPGDGVAGQAAAPLGQRGQVVVHPDDAHARGGRGLQPGRDRAQVGDGGRDALDGADGELAEAGLAAAGFGVIGADVEGNQEHLAPVLLQERDGGLELRSAAVVADTAVDHGDRGLARAAQLDEFERRVAPAQGGVDLVGVAVRGLDAGAGGVRLDALRQGVPEGEVVGGRSLGGDVGRRRAGRRRPGAGSERRGGSHGCRGCVR